jgi:putative heme transporter
MSIEGPELGSRVDGWQVARYIAGIGIGVIVLVVLFTQRDDLAAAWHQLAHLDWTWAVAAIGAELTSVLSFAFLQRRVLRNVGTDIGLAPLVAVSLANNAIALTVPGEPAVSSAFRYRQYRRRGASGAVAGWTILTVIIAQAVGMSALLLVGVLVSLATGSHGGLTGVTLVGLVIVVASGTLLVRRTMLLTFIDAVVRVSQRVTGHPKGNVGDRVTTTLAKMREYKLGAGATIEIVVLATFTWSLDFACLLCAFAAVHAPVPFDGVLLAYGVAQIVAVLPIVPGGLGLVEGSLAVILVAYGARRVPALSTVLVYRFVSYWLAIVVGWLSFGSIVWVAHRMSSAKRRVAETPAPVDRRGA